MDKKNQINNFSVLSSWRPSVIVWYSFLFEQMSAVFMWCKNKQNKKLKPLSQKVVNVSNQSTIFKLFETH